MHRILIILILLSFFISIGLAQQQDSLDIKGRPDSTSIPKPQPVLWWLTLGYGGSTVSDLKLQGFGALITLESGYNFFSVRVIQDQGDYFFPLQKIFDAGLLYGIGSHHTLWYGNISVGLAYTATTKNVFVRQDTINYFPKDIYRAELFRGIGFAYQVQLFSKFADTSPAGFGLTILGNINKSFSFWAFLLSLEFGNF